MSRERKRGRRAGQTIGESLFPTPYYLLLLHRKLNAQAAACCCKPECLIPCSCATVQLCNCATAQPGHQGPREARPGLDRSNESYSLTHRLRERQSLVDQTSQPASQPASKSTAHRWTRLDRTVLTALTAPSSLSRSVGLHLCWPSRLSVRPRGAVSQCYCPVACGWLHLPQCSGPGLGPGPGASNRQHQQQQMSKLHPRPTPLLLWPRPAPHCLVLVARHLGDEHDNGRCVSTAQHALRMLAACCILMHQGAVGLRGGCQRDWVGTSAPPSPTPSPNTTASHPVNLSQVSQSVSQSGRAAGQVGQAQLSGGKECAAHLSSCTPPVLPSGWCQWVSRLP